MSGTNAVFGGTYSDMKIVKTRSVVQVVIEMPIELAETFVNHFGLPQMAKEQYVAIAPLSINPFEREGAQPLGSPEGQKAVTACVMLCKDKAFGAWLLRSRGRPPSDGWPEDAVVEELYTRLGIKSRREIGVSVSALDRWKQIESAFRTYQQYGDDRG